MMLTQLVRDLVVRNADEEVGDPSTSAYAAVLRADLADIANDIGVEVDSEDSENITGAVGAVVTGLNVQIFFDADELEYSWEDAVARLG